MRQLRSYYLVFHLIMLCMGPLLYAQECVLFTEPKTGTHLLIPILTELTGKNVYWAKEFINSPELVVMEEGETDADRGVMMIVATGKGGSEEVMERVWATNQAKGTFLHLHIPYSLAIEQYLIKKNCVNFFIARDPRDQIVSLLNHHKHIQIGNPELEQFSDDAEKLLFLIRKYARLHTLRFKGWLQSPVCCVLTFSKLMGNHGGAATDRDALKELRKVAHALQIKISDRQLLQIYHKHFGRGWGFFKGKVGSWKGYFQEEHKVAMKEEIGDLLIELGYEVDNNW